MKQGDTVKVTFHGQTIEAEIVLMSGNAKSVGLSLDGSFLLPDGGMVFGMMPVIQGPDGDYLDLITGSPVLLQPKEPKQ